MTVKDITGCLYRQTGDPKACLNCQLPECIEFDTVDEPLTDDDKWLVNLQPTDKAKRCPYCHHKDTLVKAGVIRGKRGIKRQLYICRTCWRKTSEKGKPGKPPLSIHISPVKEGEVLDLAFVSRIAVAKTVKCTPHHVSEILAGRVSCSLPLFYDISKAIGCTMDELFKVVSGANGKNPARLRYRVGKEGYATLKEALRAIGIDASDCSHYNRLRPEVQNKIKVVRKWKYKFDVETRVADANSDCSVGVKGHG